MKIRQRSLNIWRQTAWPSLSPARTTSLELLFSASGKGRVRAQAGRSTHRKDYHPRHRFLAQPVRNPAGRPLPRLRRTICPLQGLRERDTHTQTYTHSPADVVKRDESACVHWNPDRSPPKNRLPEELSLLPPHITTERIRLSSGPSHKRSPTERFREASQSWSLQWILQMCGCNQCSRSKSNQAFSYRTLALSCFTMPIPI